MSQEVQESVLDKYLISRKNSFFSNELYELGHSDLAKYKLYLSKRVEFIAKPLSISFYDDHMVLTFPNGIKASLNYAAIKYDDKYFYKMLRSYIKWKIFMYKEPTVYSFEETTIEPAYDIADNLLNHYDAVTLIVRCMGYKEHSDVYRLLIPRILPLVKTMYPLHIWQMTRYNSGKTHYGIMLMKTFRFFYCSSPPSQAGLLYDARTGTYGWAMLSDGIVFDEVDKWNIENIKLNELLSYLPTLMEQGVIVRPTTRHTFLGLIERRIPFVFLGNIPAIMDDYQIDNMYDRDVLREIVHRWGDNIGALADRIGVVDIDPFTPLISNYIDEKVLHESVLLAIVDMVNERVKEVSPPTSSLSGRLKRHSEMLYAALMGLGVEASIDDCDYIVENGWSKWWKVVSAKS